jgi:hypothetical protein
MPTIEWFDQMACIASRAAAGTKEFIFADSTVRVICHSPASICWMNYEDRNVMAIIASLLTYCLDGLFVFEQGLMVWKEATCLLKAISFFLSNMLKWSHHAFLLLMDRERSLVKQNIETMTFDLRVLGRRQKKRGILESSSAFF